LPGRLAPRAAAWPARSVSRAVAAAAAGADSQL